MRNVFINSKSKQFPLKSSSKLLWNIHGTVALFFVSKGGIWHALDQPHCCYPSSPYMYMNLNMCKCCLIYPIECMMQRKTTATMRQITYIVNILPILNYPPLSCPPPFHRCCVWPVPFVSIRFPFKIKQNKISWSLVHHLLHVNKICTLLLSFA